MVSDKYVQSRMTPIVQGSIDIVQSLPVSQNPSEESGYHIEM